MLKIPTKELAVSDRGQTNASYFMYMYINCYFLSMKVTSNFNRAKRCYPMT